MISIEFLQQCVPMSVLRTETQHPNSRILAANIPLHHTNSTLQPSASDGSQMANNVAT